MTLVAITSERLSLFFLRNKSYLTLTVFGLMLMTTLGIVPPRPTTFRCDDVSIRHHYRKDTISPRLLLVVTLLVPFFQIMITEWLVLYASSCKRPLLKGLKTALRHVSDIFVGVLLAYYTVDILKTCISKPRPHFWYSCLPNVSSDLCAQSWITITYKNCTNPANLTHRHLIDSMKSFPSGHACLALFSAIYMIWYLQKRVHVRWSRLLVSLLQFLWVTWAVVCSASRIFDKRHHWWDVFFGASVGLAYGYATIKYLSLFKLSYSMAVHELVPSEKRESEGSLQRGGLRNEQPHPPSEPINQRRNKL